MKVNFDLLDNWLQMNGGVATLALKSGVSPYTIMKLKNRQNPLIPRKLSTRAKLANAIGVLVDQLFYQDAKEAV